MERTDIHKGKLVELEKLNAEQIIQDTYDNNPKLKAQLDHYGA